MIEPVGPVSPTDLKRLDTTRSVVKVSDIHCRDSLMSSVSKTGDRSAWTVWNIIVSGMPKEHIEAPYPVDSENDFLGITTRRYGRNMLKCLSWYYGRNSRDKAWFHNPYQGTKGLYPEFLRRDHYPIKYGIRYLRLIWNQLIGSILPELDS